MKTWSERIADLQSDGWSLTEIASAMGCSPQALSDIKQGRTKEPTGMSAVRLHNLHATGAKPPADGEDVRQRHRIPAASAGATAEATTTVLTVKVA